MTKVTNKPYNAKPVTIEGVPFTSITEAWRAGAVRSYSRLRDSVAKNEAIETRPADKRVRTVTLNGIEYPSVTKAAELSEITVNRIHAEMTRSKSRVIVLSKTKTRPGRKELGLTINGKHYRTVPEACKSTGLTPNAIQKKLANNPSRTFNIELDKRVKPVIVNGVTYESMSEAVMKTGVCFSTLSKYYRNQGENITINLTVPEDPVMRIEFHTVGLDSKATPIDTLERSKNPSLWTKHKAIPEHIVGFDVEHTTFSTFTLTPKVCKVVRATMSPEELSLMNPLKIHKDIHESSIILETEIKSDSASNDVVYMSTPVTQVTFEHAALLLVGKIFQLRR